MKIFTPLELSVSERTLEHDRKFYWVASVKMHVSLSSGKVLFEQDCIADLMAAMGDQPLPDMGMPKPQSEYLVCGSYFSENEEPVSAGQVEVKFNERKKTLNIFGDRQWSASLPTQPDPITSLPIQYQYSFGSENFNLNPEGKGFQESVLPNIENAEETITSNSKAYQPAGFGPLDPSWYQRARYQGTYDDRYLEKFFPGYPEDMDWRLFMTAPQDQWFDDYLDGTEEYRIKNMHPSKPMIFGHLPGFVPRLFIKKLEEESISNQELELRLDTAWFFPEYDTVQLIWRTMIPVASDDAEEITHVLAGYESINDPNRTVDHYIQAMDKRIENKDPLETNLNTKDLVPLSMKSSIDRLKDSALADIEVNALSENMQVKAEKITQAVDKHIKESMDDIQKQVDSASLTEDKKKEILDQLTEKNPDANSDPDIQAIMDKLEALLPGITKGDVKEIELGLFSFKKLEGIMDDIKAFTASKKKDALEQVAPEIERLKSMLAQSTEGSKLSDDQLKLIVEQIESLENLAKEPVVELQPLPRFDVEGIKSQLLASLPQVQAAQNELHLMAANPLLNQSPLIEQARDKVAKLEEEAFSKISDQLNQAREQFLSTYLLGAHYSPDGLSPHEDDEAAYRKFMSQIMNKQPMKDQDWACLSFSGVNLDGVDFSGCLMEQVNFKSCSLKGATFKGAVLARARFEGCNLESVDFTDANIGSIEADDSSFNQAKMINTKLSHSHFSHCSFDGAQIIQPELLEVNFEYSSFDGALLENWILIDRDLRSITFNKARLSGFNFVNCNLSDCQFDGAEMASTVWSSASLERISFKAANMNSNCFVSSEEKPTELAELDFTSTQLNKANLQNLIFKNCRFERAELNSANLMGSDLRSLKFDGCEAVQAQFQKADLQGASFFQANLMTSLMTKAKLHNVDFRESNLYGTDFMRSYVEGCDFSHSNLDATILRDWRPS